jgi:hypothetical protein
VGKAAPLNGPDGKEEHVEIEADEVTIVRPEKQMP